MARPRTVKPVRVRLDVDARRAQLVAHGIALFSARSFDEVSLDDVARVGGISKGLLYHYFPTKRDFYIAALRAAAQQLLDRCFPDATLPPPERLRAGLDAYLDYVHQHAPAYVALLRGGIGSDREVAHILDDTRDSVLARLLGGLQVTVVPPALRTALRGWIGFVEAASLDWVERRDLDRDTLREMLAAALTGCLGTIPGALPPGA